MEIGDAVQLIVGIATAVNTVGIFFLAVKKLPNEVSILRANAQEEKADAEDRKIDVDQKRLALYDATLLKLMERDTQLIDLNSEVHQLKKKQQLQEIQLSQQGKELEAERTLRVSIERERDELRRGMSVMSAELAELRRMINVKVSTGESPRDSSS